MEVSGPPHAPAALPPGKSLPVLTESLTACRTFREREKFRAPAAIGAPHRPPRCLVTILTELPWPSPSNVGALNSHALFLRLVTREGVALKSSGKHSHVQLLGPAMLAWLRTEHVRESSAAVGGTKSCFLMKRGK
jgi:hypothetical protein